MYTMWCFNLLMCALSLCEARSLVGQQWGLEETHHGIMGTQNGGEGPHYGWEGSLYGEEGPNYEGKGTLYGVEESLYGEEEPYYGEQEPFYGLEVSHHGRARRQAHGSLSFNSDGTSAANVKVPLAGNDKNVFSAIGQADFNDRNKLAAATTGLAWDNVNGHGATLTQTRIPGAGTRTAAAGTLNLLNGDHRVDANAFAARTAPSNPHVPNFNTYGGGLDYMYKEKIGAGVNIARTPLFDKTDYNAAGRLNLFRNHDSSLDFNAGLSKSVSPFIPKSSWQPNYGFTFRKFF